MRALALAMVLLGGACVDDLGLVRQASGPGDGGVVMPPEDGGANGPDIAVASPFDFGDVTVGDTVLDSLFVENFGGATLTISGVTRTGSSDIVVTSSFPLSIPGGSFGYIGLECTPRAVGLETATLGILSNDPDENPKNVTARCNGVSGGKPDIIVNPTSVAFGSVDVGSSSTNRTVTISNANDFDTEELVVSGVSIEGIVSGDFSIVGGTCQSGCSLAAGASATVVLRFSPTVIGARGGTLRIASNDVETPLFDVSLSGTGLQADVLLEQPSNGSINFGDIPITTTSSPRTISLRNVGNKNLTVTGRTLVGANPARFAISGPASPHTIGSGASSSWTVTCAPTAPGALTATARFTTDDPDEPQVDVALACNGISSQLTVDPSPISFPPQRIGDSAGTVVVTLANEGALATTVNTIAVAPAGTPFAVVSTSPSLPSSLASGGTMTVTLSFAPTAEGNHSANLSIVTTDETRTVPIDGEAQVAQATLTPEPEHDFGAVCVGGAAAVDTFTVTNTGTAPIEVKTVSATPASDFEVLAAPSNVTVMPSQTLDLDVAAHPTAEGEVSGELRVETDIPVAGVLTVALDARGVSGTAVAPSPSRLDFGAQSMGVASDPLPVSVVNCTASSRTITGVRISGADRGDFAIVAGMLPPPEIVIPAAEAVSWSVVLTPSHGGAHSAQLVLETSASGNITIPLTGEVGGGGGDAGPGDGDAGPTADGGMGAGANDTTYYACSSGGGAPGTMVLVVIAAIALRRRR